MKGMENVPLEESGNSVATAFTYDFKDDLKLKDDFERESSNEEESEENIDLDNLQIADPKD